MDISDNHARTLPVVAGVDAKTQHLELSWSSLLRIAFLLNFADIIPVHTAGNSYEFAWA